MEAAQILIRNSQKERADGMDKHIYYMAKLNRANAYYQRIVDDNVGVGTIITSQIRALCGKKKLVNPTNVD